VRLNTHRLCGGLITLLAVLWAGAVGARTGVFWTEIGGQGMSANVVGDWVTAAQAGDAAVANCEASGGGCVGATGVAVSCSPAGEGSSSVQSSTCTITGTLSGTAFSYNTTAHVTLGVSCGASGEPSCPPPQTGACTATGTYDVNLSGFSGSVQTEGTTACVNAPGGGACQVTWGPASSMRSIIAQGGIMNTQTATLSTTSCSGSTAAASTMSPVDSGSQVNDCQAQGGNTVCATQNSAGIYCGTYNGDQVCVGSVAPGTCSSYASGGVACTVPAGATQPQTPPAPNSGTTGIPATPQLQLSNETSSGTTTTDYYSPTTVGHSTTATATTGTGTTGNGNGTGGVNGTGSTGTTGTGTGTGSTGLGTGNSGDCDNTSVASAAGSAASAASAAGSEGSAVASAPVASAPAAGGGGTAASAAGTTANTAAGNSSGCGGSLPSLQRSDTVQSDIQKMMAGIEASPLFAGLTSISTSMGAGSQPSFSFSVTTFGAHTFDFGVSMNQVFQQILPTMITISDALWALIGILIVMSA
jgi:hypothetical protein